MTPPVVGDAAALRAWWREARMGAAISADSADGQAFAALGSDSYLAFPQGVLHGVDRIAIGAGCVVNEHVVLSAGPLVADSRPGPPLIRLGDRVVLGLGCELLAMVGIDIADDVWLASRVTIVDHHHTRDQPGVPIALQLPLDMAPVVIGAGSVLSTGVVVLSGVRIGNHTMVAAGAVVRPGDYPPGVLLAGVPARIVGASLPVPDSAEAESQELTVDLAEEILRSAQPSASMFLRALVDEGGTATAARLKALIGGGPLNHMTGTLNTAARKLWKGPQVRGRVFVALAQHDPDTPRSRSVHSYRLRDELVPVWDEALRRLGR
ncbi:MAG: acyltransferase [Umezawaea sp.]